MTHPAPPGTVLLRPVPLIALAIMLLNDHVLKALVPGALTGKLSDVTGLIVFPLLMTMAWEVVSGRAGRPVRDRRLALAVAIVATGSVFAAIKLVQPATDLYAAAIGTGQRVGAVAVGVATNTAIPGPWTVLVARDPTDLLALPALALAWLEGTRGLPRPRPPRPPAHDARTDRGRRRPAQARPSPVALVVLIIGAVASVANQPGPTPGVATTLESSVSVELGMGHDFAVRELSFTVAHNAIDEPVRRWVEVETDFPASVVLFTRPDDPTGPPGGRTWPPSGQASLQLAACREFPCVARIVLIVRMDEPVAEATTVDVQVLAGVGTSENDLVVPAQALSLTAAERPGGRARVDVGEVSGEITVDPLHPIAEQRVVVRRDPGTVGDGDLMFVDTQLSFDSDDVDETDWVSIGVGPPPHRTLTGEPVDWAFDSGPCPADEPCEATYPLQVVAGPILTRPVTVRWRIVTRLVDHDVGAPPVGRTVEGDRGEARTMLEGSRIVHSVRGEVVMTDPDRPWGDAGVHVVFNDALAAFATSERPVIVSRRLTLVATDADGIGGEEGLIHLTPVTFDVDGRPHEIVFHRLHWCGSDECVQRESTRLTLDYASREDPSAVAYPITVEWTLEVQVVAFGDELLPSDADFELLTVVGP